MLNYTHASQGMWDTLHDTCEYNWAIIWLAIINDNLTWYTTEQLLIGWSGRILFCITELKSER